MRNQKTMAIVRLWSTRIGRSLAVAAIMMAASLKTDTTKWPDALGPAVATVNFLQNYAFLVLPSVIILSGICREIERWAGDTTIWSALKAILDDYQDEVFKKEAGDPPDYHRVTLFQYRPRPPICFWFRWSGTLVPVERSGHMTRKSKSRFRVSTDADWVEGVAGLAFRTKQIIVVDKLPAVNNGMATDEQIEEYALRTSVSTEWVRERQPAARSYWAVAVEANGEIWGVVVIDSRAEEINEKKTKLFDTYYGRMLSKLLKGA
ncbi:MAG: GAF domain-containing protein [Phycisphaera sp.]|nr:GAF domain-containing protein [Phycisphaera sp.]